MINSFPGYEFVWNEEDKDFHNMFRGVDVGKGGYVYAEPGMYSNIALLDVRSMHPSSLINMNCFGEYTDNFKNILDARIAIKGGNIDGARTMLNGRLAKYLTTDEYLEPLSLALKIAANSQYGLTSSNYDVPSRDVRNKNNIVALRGALFMKTLQDEVVARGFQVVHIKTDSCKIPSATTEIIQFIMGFAKQYNYEFEHEATYEKMCLVNDAVYIAKYKDGKHAGEWTATGTQFAVPYVFKTLFSKEDIQFDDLCITNSVKTSIYIDMNEGLPDVTDFEKALVKLKKKDPSNIQERTRLEAEIAKGHAYHFVGKVGRFCPIKEGAGGGTLLRATLNNATGEKGWAAVTGSLGYRWLESEMVQELDKTSDIDKSYFNRLVDSAVETISKYGDFEWFVSDDTSPKPPMKIRNEDFDLCENYKKLKKTSPEDANACIKCPNYDNPGNQDYCKLGYTTLPF